MARLNEDMKSYFGKQLPMIATVNKEGTPNIGPKRSMRVYDDETLIYNENTGKQTLANVKETGKASVAIANWGQLDGYRFSGTAEAFTEGEYYENCVAYAKQAGMGTPKAAVIIKIEKIYTLKSGPTAGDLI